MVQVKLFKAATIFDPCKKLAGEMILPQAEDLKLREVFAYLRRESAGEGPAGEVELGDDILAVASDSREVAPMRFFRVPFGKHVTSQRLLHLSKKLGYVQLGTGQ